STAVESSYTKVSELTAGLEQAVREHSRAGTPCSLRRRGGGRSTARPATLPALSAAGPSVAPGPVECIHGRPAPAPRSTRSPPGPAAPRPSGRGRRWDLIPPHLPGYRSRRERFDDLVADAGAALAERFPRRLAHLQVLVEEVPSADPAPWEEPSVILGRVIPPSREHPARVIVYRRPLQTRCEDETELETLVRQVLSEQIGSLLGIAPEDVD